MKIHIYTKQPTDANMQNGIRHPSTNDKCGHIRWFQKQSRMKVRRRSEDNYEEDEIEESIDHASVDNSLNSHYQRCIESERTQDSMG